MVKIPFKDLGMRGIFQENDELLTEIIPELNLNAGIDV